jgi:hypothetical protein
MVITAAGPGAESREVMLQRLTTGGAKATCTATTVELYVTVSLDKTRQAMRKPPS